MLSDEVIERLTERLVNRIEEGNIYTIQQISKSIKKLGTLSPSSSQKLVQTLKYGGDYDKIIRKLKEITKLNIKDIKKIFNEVAKKDYEFAEKFYKYRDIKYIPYEENIALQNQVNSLANIAVKDYYNLTNTKVLGFSIKNPINNKVMFKTLNKAYIDALDQAVLTVSQGKDTFQNELHKIIKELGDSGLKSVEYKSGRTIRLDSAVRMNMNDSLRNLHNELQIEFGKQFDSDGVEITVHDNPAPDHADAQGKQFSNEEFEKLQTIGVAKDYQGETINMHLERKKTVSTSLSFRPISKYNCYHRVWSIVLGVSKPIYTNKQLKQIKNDNLKGFMYEGKHYTNYEGEQYQRKIETEIRYLKDKQIFAKEINDIDVIDKTQRKIKQLTKKYKEFSEISGLTTKMERMRVSGYHRVSVK